MLVRLLKDFFQACRSQTVLSGRPASGRVVPAMLKAALVIYAVGAAAMSLSGPYGVAIAPLLCLVAIAGVLQPSWRTLLPLALWALGSAVARMVTGETGYASLAIVSQAARWLLPIALMFVLADCEQAAARTLRFGAALTFTGHGIQALGLHPLFLDYLFAADARIFGAGLTMIEAKRLLIAIGAVDLLLSLMIFSRAWRFAALYMTGWALLTAQARIVHGGLAAWPEFAIRIPNAAVPLALFVLLVVKQSRRSTDRLIPSRFEPFAESQQSSGPACVHAITNRYESSVPAMPRRFGKSP